MCKIVWADLVEDAESLRLLELYYKENPDMRPRVYEDYVRPSLPSDPDCAVTTTTKKVVYPFKEQDKKSARHAKHYTKNNDKEPLKRILICRSVQLSKPCYLKERCIYAHTPNELYIEECNISKCQGKQCDLFHPVKETRESYMRRKGLLKQFEKKIVKGHNLPNIS